MQVNLIWHKLKIKLQEIKPKTTTLGEPAQPERKSRHANDFVKPTILF